jgi:hypothetical protein
MSAKTSPAKSWRDVLPIHPAAELFPMMSGDELHTLGEDIFKNGLTSPIALWRADPKAPGQLLDGRNRLDAIELVTGKPVEIGAPSVMAGEDFLACDKVIVLDKSIDPYAYVISVNLKRRHLSAEAKRKVIAALLKAQPEKSDRQIAEIVGVSHVTVGAVRAEMETTGQIDQLPKRIGKDGKPRKQLSRKSPTRRAQQSAKPKPQQPARDDEIERLNARIQELENQIVGLEREIDELRATNKSLSEKIAALTVECANGTPPPADEDDLAFPPFLDRNRRAAS